MHRSTLLSLIKSLNKEEFKDFEKFLRSPYFNTRKKCFDLFTIIKQAYPNLDANPKLQKEVVFQKLFPMKNISESTALKQLSSELLSSLEKFLKQQAFEKRGTFSDLLLLRELNNRDPKYYKSYFKKICKKQAQKQSKGINHFYYQFLLNFDAFIFDSSSNKPTSNFNEILQNLEVYVLVEKLRIYSLMHNSQLIIESDQIDFTELNPIMEKLEKAALIEHPIIDIYFSILQIFRGQNQYFPKLKQLLKSYKLPYTELKEIYTIILTYLNTKIQEGQVKYKGERFDWYLEMFYAGLCKDGKYIHYRHLNNLVTLCLQKEDFVLAKELIDGYASKVLPQYKSYSRYYNIAIWHFYKNEFEQSQKHLLKVDFIDSFHQIETKTLLLRIYYEENETIALLDLTNAFIKMVKRNKMISSRHKESYVNFSKAIKQLFKLKSNPNTKKEQVEEFDNSLNEKRLHYSSWINTKILELKESKCYVF